MPLRRRPILLDAAISNTLFTLLFLAVGAALIMDGMAVPLVTYGFASDYWEHTAALTEWMRNFTAPTNPHVVSGDLSSRFMPYFGLLSLLGQNLGLTAVQLMSVGAVVNYLLIVSGLILFSRYYFRDVWAPLVCFIAIFMLWGVGWDWSNFYQLRSFFYVGGYPSAFAFGLSLFSFWATLKFLRQDGSPIILGAFLLVLGALMLLCHPLTAVFGMTGCFALAITEKTALAAARISLIGILLASAIVAEMWPFFSVWKLMLGQYGAGFEQWPALRDIDPSGRFQSGAWAHMFYNPGVVVPMLGPVLLGIPILIWLWLKRQQSFIVVGAVLMVIPYLANLFFPIPMAHRFLLFAATYLQLALVWFFLRILTICRAEPRPAYGAGVVWLLALLMAGVIAGNFALLSQDYEGKSLSPQDFQMRDRRAFLPEGQNVVGLYETLTEPLSDKAVVLTTASLGWPLPTVKGKVVSLFHENPMLLDQLERHQATGVFFYRAIDDTKRAEIVTRYNATHVLISDRDEKMNAGVGSWLNRYAQLVAIVDSYRMYLLLDTIANVEPEPVVETPEPETPAPVSKSKPTSVPTETTSERPGIAPVDITPASDAGAQDVEPEAPTSFGAPIASPILNLPDEEAGEQNEADASAEVESFGAPVAELLLPEPDGAPPPEAPVDLTSE